MNRKLLIFLTFLVTFCTVPAQIVIKLGTEAPKGSNWDQIVQEMAFQWKQATQSQVQLKIYAGGVLGDEADMIRKMRIGQLNAVAISDSGLADIDRSAYALMVPMLFESYQEWDYAREKINPLMEQKLAQRGFRVLAWSDVGWVYFFSKKKLVLPSELKSMKLAASLTQSNTVEILKWAGFNPVPISTSDLITGLQTGLIEAFYVPIILAEGSNLYREAPNMNNLAWAPLQGAVIIRSEDWEKIPENFRPDLLKITQEAGLRLRKSTREREISSLEAMKARGLQVWEVDSEARTEWQKETSKAYPRIRQDLVTPELFDQVVALVKEFRSRNAPR